MARNIKIYTCDGCNAFDLEQKEVCSIVIEGYKNDRRRQLGVLDVCHKCFNEINEYDKITIFKRVKHMLFDSVNKKSKYSDVVSDGGMDPR
jgi:hypothetical protein